MPRVAIFHSPDCSLCERAIEVVRKAHEELGFDLEVVDITEDAALEARYRELIPVVEIDGRREFTYFVDPEALRSRLGG